MRRDRTLHEWLYQGFAFDHGIGAILAFVFWGVAGVVLLITGPRWVGALFLAMIVGAWIVVGAMQRRKAPRNPHRYRRAKRDG